MPDLPEHLRDQWRAFQELYRRDAGWDGAEQITQREMESWFNNNGIDPDEREEFTAVIQALDDDWRRKVDEKLRQRRENE